MIYYVGIDISKYKHDFCIISNAGELIVENSSFLNNKIGFQSLLEQLKPYNKSEVRIAFEATGHYSLNLELFLTNNGYTYIKTNPLIIHQFLKARSLRMTKTDKADSITIAKYLMSIPYQPNSDLLYTIFTLKSLCRARENLIKEFDMKTNSVMFFIANRNKKVAQKFAGQIRDELGRKIGLIDENKIELCIIKDFPMFEYDDEKKKYEFCHNPFSLPHGGLKDY